jgi:hypothetical protein
LRIEVDYRSEVSRTKRKKVSSFFFHSYVLKNNRQFPELSLIVQFSPTLFLEKSEVVAVRRIYPISVAAKARGLETSTGRKRQIGTVSLWKCLTPLSGAILTTLVQTNPYNHSSRQHLLEALALTMVAEVQK